jgi:predicted secreted Zn-dependent protease
MGLIGFILSLSLQFCILPQKANTSKNLMAWDEKEAIEWTDFKGTSNRSSLNAAESNLIISYEFSRGKIKVAAYFNKAKSWSKKEFETETLLRHEQFHFHTSELYARRIRQAITPFLGKANLYKNVQQTFDSLYAKHWEFQRQYDLETKHSANNKEQEKWEQEIQKELKELSNFTNPTMKIPKK